MSVLDAATHVFNTEEREYIARKEGLNLEPLRTQDTQVTEPLTPSEVDSALGDDATADRQVFAKLVPSNDAARIAFHEVAQACKNGKLHQHHKYSLFIDESSGAVGVCDSDTQTTVSSDSEDPASGSDSQTAPPSLLRGHFEFIFDHETRCAAHVGYRIGKGTSKVVDDRNVDILIVPPPSQRSSQAKQLANGIASIHSLIQVHPASGVLMLVSGSSSRPVEYLDSNDAPLFKCQSHVLFRTRNNFCLGNMLFCFEYMIQPEAYHEYTIMRNQYLRRVHPTRPAPHGAILAVPRDGAPQVDVALVHGSLSSGAFGMVSAGVHKLTGAPLAIKEIWIKETRHIAEVKKEAEISNLFSGVSFHISYIFRASIFALKRKVRGRTCCCLGLPIVVRALVSVEVYPVIFLCAGLAALKLLACQKSYNVRCAVCHTIEGRQNCTTYVMRHVFMRPRVIAFCFIVQFSRSDIPEGVSPS